MDTTSSSTLRSREPWNKGKLVGQKAPFKPKDIWAMRMRLQQEHRSRDLALLNIGLDSKLRACDLVSLKVRDISHGERAASLATVQQTKTKRPVQFEITAPAREAAEAWIRQAGLRNEDFLFPSRTHDSPHICTRQDARMLREWLQDIGLDWHDYGPLDATDEGHADLPQDQELGGKGIGYVDVHLLAAVALTKGTTLWTRDKRLRTAAQALGCAFDETRAH